MVDMKQHHYTKAWYLALFTVGYNIIEGVISMLLGYNDETLALFGFGVDSFIEVASGIGIALMILRIRNNPDSDKSKFEKSALQITGAAFYILTAGLIGGIVVNIATEHKPETTLFGVVISAISILVMLWLVSAKKRVGRALNSPPIIADASCTKVCVYMSVILLISSILYELTGFAYADTIGAAGLAYFSFKEGKEAFEKVNATDTCSCGCHQ